MRTQPHSQPPAAGNGTERADFDVGGEPDAEQFAGFARGIALLEQLVPAGQLLRLFERALVIAAVVSEAAGRIEGKFFGLGKVLQANGRWIELKLGGDYVHEAFD